ncbi:MAG TPA: hypothetical protein VG897_10780 [Terriglobales bacterium]|nr:hypothetical protein [Terriglobales bacterium]
MANEDKDPMSDRRDVEKEGSTLSGSKLRDNISTEKALHPEDQDDVVEVVDQDPGETQKRNQNQSKDDPLAA